MNDSFSGQDTASYIAKNYAVEASAWYWSKMQKTGEDNLSAYVTKNGGGLGIFLITQYYVNGVPDGTALSTIINCFEPSFGFNDFQRIRTIMPWIVKFTFQGDELVQIEEIDVFGSTKIRKAIGAILIT